MKRQRPYQVSIQTTRSIMDAFDKARGPNHYGSRSALYNAFMQDFIEGKTTPRVLAVLSAYSIPTAEETALTQRQSAIADAAREAGLED